MPPEHVKPRLLGHWGTTPGQNFLYAHILIHRLTYRRANHHNMHVRGYKEEGTITTPFDMVMLNDLDVIDRVRDWASVVRTCARRWSTSVCATAHTHVSAGTTRRMCATDMDRVLVVNARSSSVKLSLLGTEDETPAEHELAAPRATIDPGELSDALRGDLAGADVVGHRIVHGGERFREAVLIDRKIATALRELVDLAPLHQPKSLAAFDAVPAALPGGRVDIRLARGVAAAVGRAPLRLSWPLARLDRAARAGARWAPARRAQDRQLPPGRRGSLCAIAGGRSVDTTMGFTPLEGLVMATRSGTVDPGLLMVAARARGDDRARDGGRARTRIGAARARGRRRSA